MATTERGILEGKVLPELQAIASSMGVQGIQRLRKADLIGAIIAKAQGVEFVPSSTPARGRRGGTSGEAPSADAQAAARAAARRCPTSPSCPAPARTRPRPTARAPDPPPPERRGHAEPAPAGEAPRLVEVSGNGGQPAAAGPRRPR